MHVPTFSATLVDECVRVNASGGLNLLDWQASILGPWLAVTPSGRWCFSTLGNEVPRQNGKTLGVIVPRIQYGLVKRWPILGNRGERVVYTSQLQKTSTETFESIATFFDTFPAAHKRLKQVKTAMGREEITLTNGGRIKFLARNRNGGRGQHGDTLIFDEALELAASAQASFLPAISASPNPQVIYTSTPPTPESNSAVYEGIRNKALSRTSRRLVWHEWSIDHIPCEADDEDGLVDLARDYNPSMGVLISEDTVRGEVEQMSIDDFARERLGYWLSRKAAGERAIGPEAWDACRADGPMDGGKLAFGVRFTPDGRAVAVSWARAERGGGSYVELYDVTNARAGTGPIAEMLLRHMDEVAAVCVDGKAGVDALVRRLVDGGYPKRAIIEATTSTAMSANAMLKDEVESGTLSHIDSPALDASASGCLRREIGSGGGWGFADGPDCPACPVESAALALYAARTARRDPRRVQEGSF